MKKEWKKITRAEVLDYAKEHGNEAAADLLLLGGYDWYDGTVEEYDALMKALRKNKLQKGLDKRQQKW